jgi:hypothetical protein
MGKASNRKKQRREEENGHPMTLRIQATVEEIHRVGVARLVMHDVREARLPWLVLAQHCPEGLTKGASYVFTGDLELRLERDGLREAIAPVLTVQTVEPTTAISPWARLDCVARAETPARTLMAPISDADGTVLLRKHTALGMSLSTRGKKRATIQAMHEAPPLPILSYHDEPAAGLSYMIADPPTLQRALGEEEPDEMTTRLLALRRGDMVHLSGDVYLLERMPDDEPGADLTLIVETVDRV